MAAPNLTRAVYRHEEAYASTDAFLEAYSRGDAAACAALYTKDATVLPGIRIEYLMLHHLKLSAQGQEAVTRARRRYPVILAILDNLQQPFQPIAADACDNTELGQMGTQSIDQRGARSHKAKRSLAGLLIAKSARRRGEIAC